MGLPASPLWLKRMTRTVIPSPRTIFSPPFTLRHCPPDALRVRLKARRHALRVRVQVVRIDGRRGEERRAGDALDGTAPYNAVVTSRSAPYAPRRAARNS